MERRGFIAGVGWAAAGPGALTGRTAPVSAPPPPKPPYVVLAQAGDKCVKAAEELLRKCFERFAAKDSSLVDCARSASDVLGSCAALSALAATGAPFALGFARTAAELCLVSQKDCDRFPQIAECQALGAACAACAEECRKVAGG